MRHCSGPSFYGLATLALSLMLFLCWGFSPLSVSVKLGMTPVLAGLIGGLAIWRRRQAAKVDSSIQLDALPDDDFSQPVILACGNGMDAMFDESAVRNTLFGCYVKTPPSLALPVFAQAIVSQRPQWRRQLALLYGVCPEQHTDEAAFRAGIKCWRQQVDRLQKRLGYPIPLLVSCWLNGPDAPWFACASSGVVVVGEDNQGAVSLDDWLKAQSMAQQSARAALTPALNAALSWLQRAVLAELQSPDAFNAALYPVAVGIRFLPQSFIAGNLWGKALAERTTLEVLSPSPQAFSPSLPFPDRLLPLLAGFTRPGGAASAPALSALLVLGFVLIAVSLAIFNNQRLITLVGTDLKRYQAIEMTRFEPKADAVAVLKRDALLLEGWRRQGEPLRLGLGLYGGESLWLALQAEIDQYVPPPPPPPPTAASILPATPSAALSSPTPQTLRLDSLALFDAGKFTFKPDSTKVLIGALIHIKAKPGWLIVVAGHTDSTGDAKANQSLSLRRAEAVRNWLSATSDVSPACFAVQGYGARRPVAANDTQTGRAANRRVEISLVPQADACQATGAVTASPAQGDELIPKKEQ